MPRRPSPDARTEILHVRLAPAERTRLRAAADAEYLDESAWARRAILLALDAAGSSRAGMRADGDAAPGRPSHDR